MTDVTILIVLISLAYISEGIRRLFFRPPDNPLLQQWATGEQNKKSFVPRYVLPISNRLAQRFQFIGKLFSSESTEQALMYAGSPYKLTTQQFIGIQVLGALIGLILGIFVMVFVGNLLLGFLLVISLMLAGYIGPKVFWLERIAAKRQRDIHSKVGDLLDLLALSLQAGMGIDGALRLITMYMDNELGKEIIYMLDKMQVGQTRRAAFTGLVKRNKSEDLRIFVDGLQVADELGTPLSKVLEIQSEEISKHRMTRAQEQAGKVGPLMSLVAIFFIAPAIMLLFFGIMFLNLLSAGEGSVFFGG